MAYQLDPIRPEDRAGTYAGDEAEEMPPARRRLLAPALTLVVMATFAGGLWFAYHEGHEAGRDGRVPLIRADTSPFKVKPANPGGMKVPDRSMLVYNEAQPAVERLLPPPEQPLPRPEPPPAAAPPSAASVAAAPLPAGPAAVTSAALQVPLPAVSPAAPAVAKPAMEKAVAVAERAAPAKPAAERPAAERPAAERPAAERPAARSDGVRVQLGALRSEAAAHHEWQRIRRKNLDLLGKLPVTTSRADLGARGVFYRIMAGPIADAAAAERLCGELKQRSVGCLIAR